MRRLIRFIGLETIWFWLKPTFEEKGEASPKKLTAYVVTVLYVIGNLRVFYAMIDDNMVIYTLIIDAVFLCVLFNIISKKDIVDIIKDEKDK